MKRTASRALGALAALLLGVASLAGLALSAAFVVVSTDAGRSFLVPRLVRAADEALAGRIEIDSFRLLAEGGIGLEGLRVFDPDGHLVLSVQRALATVDLVRPRSRTIVLRLDIERPAVLLEQEEDGSLSLARAFAPSHPSRTPAGPPTGDSSWTVRIGHLVLRDGSLRYTRAGGAIAAEAAGISLEGRGEYGRSGSQVELKLRGRLLAPADQAASLDVEGSLRHGAVRISVLRASLGDSAVEAVAEGDLSRRSGRAAVLGAKLSGAQAHGLVPREPVTGDLLAVAYAESDGRTATGAVDIRAGESRGRGSARAAAAARVSGRLATGFEVALEGLDPSQVLSAAPPGSITLTARGRATGRDIEDLRGALSLSLAPSRLRSGELGPGELTVSVAAGTFDVGRLALVLPGGAIDGAGRYAPRGATAGRLSVDAQDLDALARNLESLLGRKLPRVGGRVHLSAQVEGSAAAPVARIALSAPAVSAGETAVRDLSISGELRGPRAALQGRFEGSAAAISIGRREVRKVGLRAAVSGRSAELAFTGLVPDLGDEPVALLGTGELTQDRARLLVSTLTLSYPGTRFTLSRPAEVLLEGPSVDLLELSSGDQRIGLAGGIQGHSLDVTATVEALAFGRLLSRLFPDWQPAGVVSARVHATGRVATRAGGDRVRALVADARVELASGSARGVKGLTAVADLRYEGESERATLRLDARRGEGGELSALAELPVNLTRAAPGSPVSAQVALRSVPAAEILRIAAPGVPEECAGVVSVEAQIAGTVGAPSLTGTVDLAGVTYGEWGPATLRATVEGGDAEAKLGAAVDLRGGRLLVADAHLPLHLSDLLREPRRAARDLSLAPITATVTVPGFDLSRASGMGTIPSGLSGQIAARALLHGSWRSPRLQATLDLSGGAYDTYRGLGLHAEAKAGDAAVDLVARGRLGASEIVRLSGRVGLPLERLATRPALEEAPFNLELVLPESTLERVQPSFPVSGTVKGSVVASGTLASPRIDLDLQGRRLSLASGPLGDVDATARYVRSDGRARVELRAAHGGTLSGELHVAADLGLPALRRGGLGASPAQARLVARGLDLAILPVMAPGAVRTAQGTLDADVQVQGALSEPRPLGTVKLAAKRLAAWELGEWTDVVIDASVDRDLFRIAKLEAHRGGGVVTGHAEARGLAGRDPAELTGELASRDLTIARAGQDLATIDLDLSLRGRLDRRDLRADVTIPDATVRLPKQSPRPLQSLQPRSDVTIGLARKKTNSVSPAAAVPYHALVHVLVPDRFFVTSESPRASVELKADVTVELAKGELAMTGTIDTLRGQVEPIGGRVFAVEKGRVQFMGPPSATALDVTATYDNPVAKVRVVVSGPVAKPEIRMTSQPPLDESQIALLIATGRTALKANSGGVGTLTSEEASRAALGSVATQLFKDLVAEKLPIDSVAVEPGQLRAGKYVTDRIYVGYTRRFETQLQPGVNLNELRTELQITPRWNFELRYGDAGSGGASLVWSKDY